MADREVYLHQSALKKDQMPRVFCKKHNNSVCETVNLIAKSNQSIFVCMDCAIEDQVVITSLLSLKKLFSENDSEIIPNWPIFVDNKPHQQLNNTCIKNSQQASQISEVNFIFDSFIKDLTSIVEEHRKKIIVHINEMESLRLGVISKYQAMSDKQSIMKNIISLQQDERKIEDYLRSVIYEKHQYKIDNHKTIQSSLDRFYQYNNQLDFDSIKKSIEGFTNRIHSIDFLQVKQSIAQEVSNIQSTKSQLIEPMKNLQPQTLQKVGILKNNQKRLKNNTNALTISENESSQNSVNRFQNNARQNLGQTGQSSNIYSNLAFSKSQDSIQNNSPSQQNEQASQLIRNTNSKTIVAESQNIFQDIIEEYQNQGLDLGQNFSKLDIVKTNYYQSQDQVSIVKLGNGHIVIANDGKIGKVRQVYINEEILKNKKYQIILSVHSKGYQNREIFMELLPYSKRDQAGWISQFTLYTSSQTQGLCEIAKGQHFSEFSNSLKDIRFQINLEKSFFYSYAEVHEQNNVIYQRNWDNYQEDEKYYFYIAMINPNAKVIIKEFKMVEEFDNWY